MLHLLGIDHTKLTYLFNGRNMRLTDVYGELIPQIVARALAILLAAGVFQPTIPREWKDADVQSLEVPLANPAFSGPHIRRAVLPPQSGARDLQELSAHSSRPGGPPVHGLAQKNFGAGSAFRSMRRN